MTSNNLGETEKQRLSRKIKYLKSILSSIKNEDDIDILINLAERLSQSIAAD